MGEAEEEQQSVKIALLRFLCHRCAGGQSLPCCGTKCPTPTGCWRTSNAPCCQVSCSCWQSPELPTGKKMSLKRKGCENGLGFLLQMQLHRGDEGNNECSLITDTPFHYLAHLPFRDLRIQDNPFLGLEEEWMLLQKGRDMYINVCESWVHNQILKSRSTLDGDLLPFTRVVPTIRDFVSLHFITLC